MININEIKPLNDRILVKIQEKPTETEAGLILSDTASNSAPVMGEIIEVGDKSKLEVGTTVFFRRYAVDELKIPNEVGDEDVVYFLEDNDVLGFIKVEEIIKNKYKAIKDKKLIALNNIKDNANDETKGIEEGVSLKEGSPKKGRKKAG
jgi:co-chaperonin GroES (HSP10)